MKIFFVTITAFTFFTLISCNQSKQDSGQTDQASVPSAIQEQNMAESTDSTEAVETKTARQPLTEQNNSEPRLNPPHGEPYHRCDIPVGEPLNPASADEQNDAEVMLNPPHGEPHHRCDIPVGEPLNSSPANTTRQTTNSQAQTTAPDLSNNPTAPTVENAKRLNSRRTRGTTAPATGEKPDINPPHGQPWHRCDIAVGSALP